MNRFVLLFSALLLGSVSQFACADLLWDSGAPHLVQIGEPPDSWAGYSSGSLISSDKPQLEVAAPFEITGGSATVTQINVDWTDTGDPNSGGQMVDYTIWRRTGLNAPVNGDQISSGTLGNYYAPAIDDPRIVAGNDSLHQYSGLNIPLPAGDYYLSVFASGAGSDGVDSKLTWLTGADLQPSDLEWNGIWRSYSLPSPGFFALSPTSTDSTISNQASTIQPGSTMSDPLNRWNVSFAIYGTPTPEPSAIALLAVGALGLVG